MCYRGSQKQIGKCKWLQLRCDILQKLLCPQQRSSWLTRWIYLLLQKTVWDDVSCSASLRCRVRDYIIYHCQLYRAPQKVKDVRLLAVTSLYFDIRTPIISSKMYLYWSDIYHQQTYIFKYNFLHFAPLLQMTLPPNSNPMVSFRNYNCCRLHAPGGDLCKLAALPVCKSSASLWSSCGSSFRLTVSLYLSTDIHLLSQWVCHLNSEKYCSLFAILLYI